MSIKYKIENAKLNKKLVGNVVTVSKIKKTYDDIRQRKTSKAPMWFTNFVEQKFDPLVKRIDNLETRFNKLETRFNKLETRIDNLETRFDNIIIANNLKK